MQGWRDSNPRHQVLETCALTGLSYTPKLGRIGNQIIQGQDNGRCEQYVGDPERARLGLAIQLRKSLGVHELPNKEHQRRRPGQNQDSPQHYFVSLWSVCFLQRLQYFDSSNRSSVLRRFLVVL